MAQHQLQLLQIGILLVFIGIIVIFISLITAIKRFEKMKFKSYDLVKNAERFSKESFQKEFLRLIENVKKYLQRSSVRADYCGGRRNPSLAKIKECDTKAIFKVI